MAFCPNCGTQAAGAAFCPNCGTAVAGPGPSSAAPGAGYQAPNPAYQQPQALNASGMSENVAGALTYLFGFITGIVFLVLAPYNQNKFVRFNAFQVHFPQRGVVSFVCRAVYAQHYHPWLGFFALPAGWLRWLCPLALLDVLRLQRPES